MSDNRYQSSSFPHTLTKASKEPIYNASMPGTTTRIRERTVPPQDDMHETESSTNKQSSRNETKESAKENNLFETSVVYWSLLDKLYDRIKNIGLTVGSYE